jgi:hypothetical protein
MEAIPYTHHSSQLPCSQQQFGWQQSNVQGNNWLFNMPSIQTVCISINTVLCYEGDMIRGHADMSEGDLLTALSCTKQRVATAVHSSCCRAEY